jgi:hypothetical protein
MAPCSPAWAQAIPKTYDPTYDPAFIPDCGEAASPESITTGQRMWIAGSSLRAAAE